MVYTRSEQLLKEVLDEQLAKQTREGLAKIFKTLGCAGVANQIKRNRNVVGNVEYGVRHCVHDKIGTTVNVTTGKVSPQTEKSKKLESNFVKTANKILVNGGYRKISPKIIPRLRREDKAFERRMKKKYRK